MVMLINTLFQIVMHIDTLNTKYDADVQVKRLVRSMGIFFQTLGVSKKKSIFYCLYNSAQYATNTHRQKVFFEIVLQFQ